MGDAGVRVLLVLMFYMVNPWFKFYGSEYLSDPKIGILNGQERSCWVTLLCLAGNSSTPGIIEYLTVEVLLEKSGIHFDAYDNDEWIKILGVLERFERMKMIKWHLDGTIEVLNWKKRQETNLTDAERAKSYRDRKKERHANVTDNVTNVTQEENRKEKKRIYTTKYGEFQKVQLSDEEYTKLVEKYGKGAATTLIGELDGYLEASGKRYKSHYATLLNWARRKQIEPFRAPVSISHIELSPEEIELNKARLEKTRANLTAIFKK